MPTSFTDSSSHLTGQVVDFLWHQWSSIGVAGYARHAGDDWIIDPEALLLLTTRFGRHDSRLLDESIDWLVKFGRRINLQRLQNLYREWPGVADPRVLAAISDILGQQAVLRKWRVVADLAPEPSNCPKPKKGGTITLTGDEFYKAMHPPSPHIIHSHNEQDTALTLLKSHAGSSHNTLAMESHRFSCNAAIFGVHLKKEDLNCHGIRLHLDHLDTWVGRRAFQHYSESYETEDGERKLSQLLIPISRSLSIPPAILVKPSLFLRVVARHL